MASGVSQHYSYPRPTAAAGSKNVPTSAKRLTVLSWNTSNAQRSCQGPAGWGRLDQEEGIAQAVLKLSPDV
eukprot:scaffold403051_cov35-Prasinocladus_malaysianus.AAC.1